MKLFRSSKRSARRPSIETLNLLPEAHSLRQRRISSLASPRLDETSDPMHGNYGFHDLSQIRGTRNYRRQRAKTICDHQEMGPAELRSRVSPERMGHAERLSKRRSGENRMPFHGIEGHSPACAERLTDGGRRGTLQSASCRGGGRSSGAPAFNHRQEASFFLHE